MESTKRNLPLASALAIIVLGIVTIFFVTTVFEEDDTSALKRVEAISTRADDVRLPSRNPSPISTPQNQLDSDAEVGGVEPDEGASGEQVAPVEVLIIDENFQPVADADVSVEVWEVQKPNPTFQSQRARVSEAGKTNELGLYAIKLQGFLYSIRAKKDGLGFAAKQDFPAGHKLLVLQLLGAVQLRGVVFDEFGNRIPRARVNFRSQEFMALSATGKPPFPPALKADDSGEFSVPVFPGTRGTVYAARKGGRSNEVDFLVLRDSDLDIVLQFPGRYRLRGIVQDDQGQRLSQGSVVVDSLDLEGYPLHAERWSQSVAVAASGEFEILLPAPGEYEAFATDEIAGHSLPTGFRIRAETPWQSLTLRMADRIDMPVRVLDCDGNAVAQVRISAEPVEFEAASQSWKKSHDIWRRHGGTWGRARATTDKEGRALLKSLVANENFRLSLSLDRDGEFSATRVPVVATTTPCEFRLAPEEQRTFTIRGRLSSSPEGTAIANHRIQLLWQNVGLGMPQRTTQTDKNGLFEFRSLYGGPNYFIQCHFKDGPTLLRDLGPRQSDLEIELKQPEAGAVDLLIIDARGNPLPFRFLSLRLPTNLWFYSGNQGRADGTGHWRDSRVAPSTYEVYSPGTPEPLATIQVNSGETTKLVLTIPD